MVFDDKCPPKTGSSPNDPYRMRMVETMNCYCNKIMYDMEPEPCHVICDAYDGEWKGCQCKNAGMAGEFCSEKICKTNGKVYCEKWWGSPGACTHYLKYPDGDYPACKCSNGGTLVGNACKCPENYKGTWCETYSPPAYSVKKLAYDSAMHQGSYYDQKLGQSSTATVKPAAMSNEVTWIVLPILSMLFVVFFLIFAIWLRRKVYGPTWMYPDDWHWWQWYRRRNAPPAAMMVTTTTITHPITAPPFPPPPFAPEHEPATGPKQTTTYAFQAPGTATYSGGAGGVQGVTYTGGTAYSHHPQPSAPT